MSVKLPKKIKFLDLFAGCGGFRLALENVLKGRGVKIKTAYSELDKDQNGKTVFAKHVYRKHFPDAFDLGDIRDVKKEHIISHLKGKPDITTFGWPCQDNSIAGKSKGQRPGTRSGLIFEANRIIRSVQSRYFIAENVPGLLSINEGVDYIQTIRLLSVFYENLPEYNVEMCVYNSCWFLPQLRKRIFFVGHLRRERRPEILPFGEDLKGITEGVSRPSNIRTITAGGNSAGLHSNMTLISHCIDANYGKGHNPNDNRTVIRVAALGKGGEGARVYDVKGISPSLKKGNGHSSSTNFIIQRGRAGSPNGIHSISPTITKSFTENNYLNAVRRLTPVECERLQSFPDQYTAIGIDENGNEVIISDSQRYRMLGEAVSVIVAEVFMNRVIMAMVEEKVGEQEEGE